MISVRTMIPIVVSQDRCDMMCININKTIIIAVTQIYGNTSDEGIPDIGSEN